MTPEHSQRQSRARRSQTTIQLVERIVEDSGRTWRTVVLITALSLPLSLTAGLLACIIYLHPLSGTAGAALGGLGVVGRLLIRRRQRSGQQADSSQEPSG